MGQDLLRSPSPIGPQWLQGWELRPWAFPGWGLRFQTQVLGPALCSPEARATSICEAPAVYLACASVY